MPYEILLQHVSIVSCLCIFGISHFGLYYLYSSTKKHEEIGADDLTSGLKGLVWGTFTGSVQGITFYNDVALEKNVVDSFSGYTKTTGNVLNTFYGATTTMISNESSFDKE